MTKSNEGLNLISIIVPVHNVKQYLNRCIQSLVAQTYSNIEIILIDDGSTDGSQDICDTWERTDWRIKVIHQKNFGISVARNSGLDIAKGDFIMFVDSDDYVASDICEILIDEITKKDDIDCVICGALHVDDTGVIAQLFSVETPLMLSGIDAIKDRYLANLNRLNIVNCWGKLFRKSIWENLRFTGGIYYEDLDIMPHIFTKCRYVYSIPHIGYFYYQRLGSASHGTGTDNKRFIDSFTIREKHILFFDKIGEKEIAQSIRKKLFDLIITSDYNGWIPPEYSNYCKQLFSKHWKLLNKEVSIKEWIRYKIFDLGGIKFYKKIKKIFNI